LVALRVAEWADVAVVDRDDAVLDDVDALFVPPDEHAPAAMTTTSTMPGRVMGLVLTGRS
jgi:hypothetical protein